MLLKLKQSSIIILFSIFIGKANAQTVYKFLKSVQISGGNIAKTPFVWQKEESQIQFTLPTYHGKISYFEGNTSFPTIKSAQSTSFANYQDERELPSYKFEFILANGEKPNFQLSAIQSTGPKHLFKNLIKVSKPYHFQGFYAVTVIVSPFRLVQGKIITCEHLTLKYIPKKQTIPYPSMHHDFNTIAQQLFINFDQTLLNPKSLSTKLLIITTKQIALSGALDKFKKWKYRNNIKTETHIYPEETGKGVESLKLFIHQHRPTHLLLCGNPADIPSKTFYRKHSQWFKDSSWAKLNIDHKLDNALTTDQYYAGVDPTTKNYIPNLFVSRIPISDPKQVKAMTERIITYSSSPQNRGHILAIADNENNRRDLSSQALIEGVKNKYPQVQFKILLEKNKSLSTRAVAEALNNQPKLTIYLGHGLIDHWQTSGYQAKEKTKPTLFFQPICQTGAILPGSLAIQQCKTGAIGVFASSNNCYEPISTAITQATLKTLNQNKFTTIGGLLLSSTIDLTLRSKALSKPQSEAEYICLQFNYFGDASMSTAPLQQLFAPTQK
jgi:hypothetical protein